MPRALTIVEDTDRERDLLERAKAFAAGESTDLVVAALATPAQLDKIESTLDAIGRVEHTSYDESDVLEGVSGNVDDLASEILEPTVDYALETVIAETDDQAEAIIALAERTGCDHVFLPGARRSPTGKAVFGDRTQGVILNFDGFVTVSMT